VDTSETASRLRGAVSLSCQLGERWMSESSETKPPAVPKNGMDKFIDGIELIAAIFVGIVAADIFISVALRACCRIQIPDSYDFGRLLLGILIFWGIAATSYRGAHISVDLLWAASSKRWQRVIDVFATLVLLFVVTTQTVMLFDKVRTTYYDNVLTYDLHLPTWPFFALAWLGDVSAVVLIAIRTWRLVFNPEKMDADHAEVKS
jgi:TRAP-type transport system small permease protein